MFQFKKTGLGIGNASSSKAEPVNSGPVRTFKQDLENARKGISNDRQSEELPQTKQKEAEKILPPKEVPAQPVSLKPSNPFPPQEPTTANPFQSIPTPPPVPAPGSFPPPGARTNESNSFFPEKTATPANSTPASSNIPGPAQKKKGRFGLVLTVIILLAALGGGSYYYWFYMKDSSFSGLLDFISQTTNTANTSKTAPSATPETENKNLRQLSVDTSQGPAEIKTAIEKFAIDFAQTASAKDLVEIKIIGKDSQLIGKEDFLAGLGLVVPDPVAQKLSEDYSLFLYKDGELPRTGIVFKTVTSSGLMEMMKSWESTLIADIAPAYLGRMTKAPSASFTSSRYNNADIRYFNIPGQNGDSLDYSVISNFLIIGTSREATQSILSYMATK